MVGVSNSVQECSGGFIVVGATLVLAMMIYGLLVDKRKRRGPFSDPVIVAVTP